MSRRSKLQIHQKYFSIKSYFGLVSQRLAAVIGLSSSNNLDYVRFHQPDYLNKVNFASSKDKNGLKGFLFVIASQT